MDRIRTFEKYIIWVVAFYLFTMLLTYIGLNATYKNIESDGEVPEGVKINLSQATSVNGRILGEVTSTESNNLNGKYLKVDIFSKNNQLIGSKYLPIEDTNFNEPKKFAVYFSAENVKGYSVDILENTEETRKMESQAKEWFKKIFKDKDLKLYFIITLIIYAMFA